MEIDYKVCIKILTLLTTRLAILDKACVQTCNFDIKDEFINSYNVRYMLEQGYVKGSMNTNEINCAHAEDFVLTEITDLCKILLKYVD